MKTIITIAIVLCSIGSMAQKQSQIVPDCSPDILSFQTYPCKVPVVKNGKTVGYTERNLPYFSAAVLSSAVLDKNLALTFDIRPLHYRWLTIHPKYGKPWYVDNPDSSGGKYIIHMTRKNFKWINDSTAVYSPDSLIYKNHKK